MPHGRRLARAVRDGDELRSEIQDEGALQDLFRRRVVIAGGLRSDDGNANGARLVAKVERDGQTVIRVQMEVITAGPTTMAARSEVRIMLP